MGNFAIPIFEGIHFLLHLGDKTPHHSFYDHEDSHSHKVLVGLSDLLGDNTDNPVYPISKQPIKKIVHPIGEQPIVADWTIAQPMSDFWFPMKAIPPPFLSVTIPPPKI